MRVVWVVHDGDPGLRGDLGSMRGHWSAGRRLRVGWPATWMGKAGIGQWLLSPPSHDGLAAALELRPDVAVVSGLYPIVDERRDARSYFDCVTAFRQMGVTVVADLAENHFQDFRAAEYREMIGAVDGLIVNTRALADVIAEETGRASVVIGDPVEAPRGEPRFDPPRLRGALMRRLFDRRSNEALRLLWFGAQGRNYDYLRSWYPRLSEFSGELPLELTLVAGPIGQIEADLAQWNRAGSTLALRYEEWSLETTRRELAHCHVVLLPSKVGARMIASTNRLAESVWAGRFVVASGVPSYWQFRDAAWIGDDMIEGLRWSLRRPREARARIARGQSIIEAQLTPERIGGRWIEVLSEFASRAG